MWSCGLGLLGATLQARDREAAALLIPDASSVHYDMLLAALARQHPEMAGFGERCEETQPVRGSLAF